MADNVTPLREPRPVPRIPPTNIEAEQHLLGILMRQNRLLAHAEIVRPDDFANALHGRIFETLAKFIARGDVANPVTLRAIFDQDAALTEAGGARYLVQLATAAEHLDDRQQVESYADEIHGCWLRRELGALLEEGAAATYRYQPDDPPAAQIERIEAALHRLAEGGQAGSGFQPLSVATGRALEIAEDAFKRGAKIAGVPTGFADLDKSLGGLHRSDLVILASRPGMGKTALALIMALHAAKNGETVGFYSLEMAAEQLGGRVLSGESGIAADWIRRADLNREHLDKLADARRQTDDLPLYIDATPGLTVAAMHSRARRLKRRRGGLDLIITDYLQLAQAPRPDGRREQNRVQEVSEITRGLKLLAKDLDVPVLALSQLSRSVETRDDKRPLLADLRESGSIEQDADVVMFLYRDEYYLREPDPADAKAWSAWRDRSDQVRNKAELIIAKNRHGPTDKTVKLHFNKATTQFSDLVRGFGHG